MGRLTQLVLYIAWQSVDQTVDLTTDDVQKLNANAASRLVALRKPRNLGLGVDGRRGGYDLVHNVNVGNIGP